MIVLIGAGGHGKVVADILMKGEETIIFYDENPAVESNIYSYKVVPQMPDLSEVDSIIICIGNNNIRKKKAIRLGVTAFAKAIHCFSCIAGNVEIGEGSVVMAGGIINPFVTIGKHCIINTASSVDHDCKIADFVHISPNATLCGNVRIGEGTHIGAGAIVIPGIKIGKWATIGAGSVIIHDVPDYAVIVGNPGKIIKVKDDIDYE